MFAHNFKIGQQVLYHGSRYYIVGIRAITVTFRRDVMLHLSKSKNTPTRKAPRAMGSDVSPFVGK